MGRKLIITLILSILTFLSTSFLTVISHLTSPVNKTVGYKSLEIGFPFKYYEEFMIDCPNPNYGWNLNNLIIDIILTLIIVSGIMFFINKKNVLQHRV
jgi:hypothetical protein